MKTTAVMAVIFLALCVADRAWAVDEFYGSSRTERIDRTERRAWDRTNRTERTDRPLRAYEEENVPVNDDEKGEGRKERKTPVFKEW